MTIVEKKDGGASAARGSKVMAGWAVANSRGMGVVRVSYGPASWVAGQAKGEWQQLGPAGPQGKTGAVDPHRAQDGSVRIFVAQ